MTLLFVAVGAATLGILVVMGISLVRQLRRLAGALRDFSAAITPAVQDIQREGDRAQVLADRIERRRQAQEKEKEQSHPGRSGRGRRKR